MQTLTFDAATDTIAPDMRALTAEELEQIAGGPFFFVPGYLALQGFKAGVYTALFIESL